MRRISWGGIDHKPWRFAKRWQRFWLKRSGLSPLGRLASRLAAMAAPPHTAQVRLAYVTPRGYIDASVSIYHSNLQLGRNVYLAPRIVILQAKEGGALILSDKVAIHRDTILENGLKGHIKIGVGSSIHPGSQIKAYGEPIIIGNGVMIAANTALYSYDHGMAADQTMRKQPLVSKGPIIIHDEAWIGTGAIILSGVTIGEGAVIGAGSVVTKSVPAGAIVAGNPARIVKYRSELDTGGSSERQE